MAINFNIGTNAVSTFNIPEELAKELSELLVKQTVRETLLTNIALSGNDRAYDNAEKNLMEVVNRIETIKKAITRDYIPEQYMSADYIWNYDGYDIDGTLVRIYPAQ